MKKLLCLGLLSLASVAASAADARAWFSCCHNRCCNKYTTTLCIRPYNAFSPVAYGNMVADGCMPINMYGGQLPPMQQPSCFNGGGGCCSAPGCFTSGCCDSGCLPPAGSYGNFPPTQMIPGQQMPQGNPGQQFTPPNPQPVGMQGMPMQNPAAAYGYAYGYGPVQPAGYYAGYQPMANPYYYPMTPMNAQPQQQQQAPGYWYGR